MQSTDSSPSSGDCSRYILQVYVGALSLHYEALSVEASKQTTAEEIVSCIVERLGLPGSNYELAEVADESKERRLSPEEKPVSVMLLWPMHSEKDFHRFYLRESQNDIPWLDNFGLDPHILRDFIPFLLQPENREYPDLCQLPDLNESTLLENLRQRFDAGHIYTYVGSILIAVNPFKFHPIYNPKYVRLYQNQKVGPILPPHIFAIADNAYYCMLKEKRNQCVVISGESGSGKTESTNFLLHHLTALSQKGSHGSGVEQTILSAGPVLEAFGNAKTAHNNNSSRFGKFIQVNYRENGLVQGAVVQKYLLEKSRIVSQGPYERNYHVFYYLLSGATEQEREALHLLPADKYNYLNAKNLILENCDEKYEFSRLKQSMEMVGFSAEKQRRLFNVLSAVLLLGNVEFFPKKSTYHHDESVQVRNSDVVSIISELLRVKHDTLLAALTSKRVKASGETLIMQYKLPEAIAARDALAKCLYGALFDWIVLQVNHALLNKDPTGPPHTGHSIGVLDIFGFEDFGAQNSFEQLCINYANEHLQYYFNLHVFKYEQNEYKREGIKWRDIEFMDNSGCLQLFESKPTGLLCILDDLCNFPGATNEALLQKYNTVHRDNPFYEKPQKKENAFIIKHYAGKVKYQVAEMREKNLDLMRQDIVSVLKNSSMAFVRELVGADPVAVFRWAILRAFFRGYFAFRTAGIKHRLERADQAFSKVTVKTRYRPHNDLLISKRVNNTTSDLTSMHHHQQSPIQQFNYMNKSPRRSWSSIAFNNKNFPDGKLGYENSQNSNNNNNNSDSGGNNKLFAKGFSKFERSSQDVMARASQIVQKNKSFRPRERPKKGLKNLQTVKTLTAGQNLSNQTSIKTRKQPLTVSAQFQNSLTALMDTLNQANPFFIRCIKSNPSKIPNKFDDNTVTRQLRYTGMLETVRIRRAGYNVRLTYEEFIQLYRILLPKGLVSSQKDVRDFMNTMDLNKQHYQLGVTKIYMRESQKMRLDVKLHTKILGSIVKIQRWFRSILQRRKFVNVRSAVVTLQSFWRMCMAQKQLLGLRQERAAAVIQATWRMYVTKKWFTKLKNGTVLLQSHIRGKLARAKFKIMYKQKLLKERSKLRPTQSLPANERSIDVLPPDVDTYGQRVTLTKPHSSLDTELENAAKVRNIHSQYYHHVNRSEENLLDYSLLTQASMEKRDVLNKAENQFRSLMISSGNNNKSFSNSNSDDYHHPDYQNVKYSQHDKQQHFQRQSHQEEPTSLVTMNDIRKAYMTYIEPPKSYDPLKAPVRRVDSGPTPVRRSEMRYEESPSRMLGAARNVGSLGNSNVEIVYVDSNVDPTATSSLDSVPLRNPPSVNNQQQQQQQQYLSSYKPTRREIICRSSGDEINSNYQASLAQQQQSKVQSVNYSVSPSHQGTSSQSVYVQQHNQEHPEFLQKAFYSAPKGKAAALLGTITEDKVRAAHAKETSDYTYHSKTGRRVKTNLSDDVSDVNLHSHIVHPRRGALSSESLRRRNSDPTTNKVPLLEVNRGNDMYQSSTHINIAGHRFRKAARIGKAEKCASCEKSDAFVNEGHRCLDCKVLVHTKCIQNGGVKTLQCEAKRSKRRKMMEKGNEKPMTPNSKYSGTREYTDSTDKIISDAKELQLMQDFITQKICKMESDCGKPSEVDRVFKQALREFKDNLVAHYSVAHKQNSDALNIKYRDLIANFEQVMETCCGRKDDFPLTMGVNAFRGFMNEFMNSRETEKPKTKRKKDKKRKIEEHTSYNGHTFQLTIINIPTACEICQLFLLWPIERGLVCQNCRLTCHKKCYQKTAPCNKISGSSGNISSSQSALVGSKLFGCSLTSLCAAEGGVKIPVQIEQLITKIEMHGLYAEGIYRKSGVNSKIKELKMRMSENAQSTEVDYESYNVHVLTNVLKSFLREMPEPLLSFDRYDDFLRAAELSETNDRVQTMLSLIKKLPPCHHALLERLIFHLALVAQREQYNRMSASSLAIVFAPCVLRTNRIVPAQDSLNDIGRQTKCIETLITQKMHNVKSTLADIDTLDTAAHTATTRLSTLRSSKVFTPEELAPRQGNLESEAEEILLEGHIQEIKKEKALLTSTLPSLARASSDDDLLSTDLDGEGGSLDDLILLGGGGGGGCSGGGEGRDPNKDSVDSALYSLGGESSRNTFNSDVEMMEYAAQSGEFMNSPRSQQISMEREAFLRGAYNSPKVASTSKWSSSQQNLSHAPVTVKQSSCELQRQKPIVMRSISTGYDTPSVTIQHHQPCSSGAGAPEAASGGAKEHKGVGAKGRGKSKRQNSLDDEPIMV
ncbi:unconventional myosin-IXa-like isoform X2 [Phlebotomus argentipes]|uniref:unconventional myosin-IXa-like isoform X2 n=1 Tax=Phlebotomus argentipes TaxID=94469 RepID=UPI002892C099|nr:unconventional myosin-IXa-like isoform X2 [Phlebotomus argentipes]